MKSLSLIQMEQTIGKSTASNIVDGVCYVVLGADLILPIGAKLGLFTVSPLAGAIVSIANLGCTAWYIAS